MTPQPPGAEDAVHTEERVEYRDEKGNILNEEEIAALDGKVSFNTRYETRTRVLDANGNEIEEGSMASPGVAGGDKSAPGGGGGKHAPPHPDVDRQPETFPDGNENDKREYPATASPEDDIGKEKSVEGKNKKKAKPASDGKKATKGEL